MITEKIITTAKKYIGQKEISGNTGFIDKKFQELLEIVGWKEKYAWCALFAELVWKESYSQLDSSVISEIDKLFSAGSAQTFVNFSASGEWETGTIPKPGAIVIWQNYKNGIPQWTGHTGIVTAYIPNSKTFKTVEGNTNAGGSSEGDMVMEKTRPFPSISTTFKIKGFIYPKQV